MDRIIDAFPTNQQEQIRTQLSASIVAVVSQCLLAKASGMGRVAAYEIMISTPAIANLIREKKTHNIFSAIQTGGRLGMQTMDQALQRLYQRGLISYKDALEVSADPEEFKKSIS